MVRFEDGAARPAVAPPALPQDAPPAAAPGAAEEVAPRPSAATSAAPRLSARDFSLYYGRHQALKAIRYDCDADALLALVEPAGPACHTGNRTCFYRTIGAPQVAAHEALAALSRTLAERRRELPDGSYSAELFRAGPEAIGAKVEEEAEEVARAGREETDDRLRAEAADLIYHLGVLLHARGLSFSDALGELTERMPVAK